jgi:hypothetical protein
MNGRTATSLLAEREVISELERAWTMTWPDGPVFIRFEGNAEDLEDWMQPVDATTL